MTTDIYYDYTIGEHFAPALINDDYTGLEDDEHDTLDQWVDDNEMRSGYWTIESESSDFAKCEITGLLSDCVTIRQYFRR